MRVPRPPKKRPGKVTQRDRKKIEPGSTPTRTILGKEVLHPASAEAKRVTSPGIHYKADRKRDRQEFGRTPPRVHPHPPKWFEERVLGTVRGRMAIVGYLRRGGPTHKLLARCACGRYERRNLNKWAAGLENGTNDACQECKHRERQRRLRIIMDEVGTVRASKWGPEQRRAVENFYSLGNAPPPTPDSENNDSKEGS